MMEIHNPSDKEKSYDFRIVKLSDLPGSHPMYGYADIPDARFVVPEGRQTVAPRSKSPVRLRVNVPADENFSNRRWEVGVHVIELQPEGMVGLAVMGKLRVETEPAPGFKARRKEWDIVLAPSNVTMKGLSGQAEVAIHNPSSSTLTVLVVPESPPDEVRDKFIPLTPGFMRLPEEEWLDPVIEGETPVVRIYEGREISPMKKVTLSPGKSAAMKIRLNASRRPIMKNEKWEGYIFVRCVEMNESRFVRVRILP